MNPGEGALDGLRRELREEIGWELDGEFSLFASFPNVYPYKNVVYNTCDLFFTLSAPDLKAEDLILEKAEIAGLRFLRPREVDFDELAFESTRRAVKAYIDKISL